MVTFVDDACNPLSYGFVTLFEHVLHNYGICNPLYNDWPIDEMYTCLETQGFYRTQLDVEPEIRVMVFPFADGDKENYTITFLLDGEEISVEKTIREIVHDSHSLELQWDIDEQMRLDSEY